MNLFMNIGRRPFAGKPAYVPLNHTIIAGITGSGKTVTTKTMLARLCENPTFDLPIILFDVKRRSEDNQDYVEFGVEIPSYVSRIVKPLPLRSALEEISGIQLGDKLPRLIENIHALDTYQDVYRRFDSALTDDEEASDPKKRLSPFRRDAYLTLRHLLGELMERLERLNCIYDPDEFMKNIRPGRVHVMNLTELPNEIQQIALVSTIDLFVKNAKPALLVIEEASRFIPQQYATDAKRTIVRAIQEGRSSHIFVWLVNQTITGIDKDVIKSCHVWLLGRQREYNEVQRILRQIPAYHELSTQDIMTLKIGQFLLCTEDEVTIAEITNYLYITNWRQKVKREEVPA